MEVSDFSSAIKYIGSKSRFGEKPGVARVDRIAKDCGLYDKIRGIKFIHIAGTNGKGSASVMCASVLSKAGFKTGLYVSPHIEDFCERISIDGIKITESEFVNALNYFIPYAEALDTEKLGDIKEFELITLCALLFFAQSECEYVVFETGLGGRLDATNIISPLVSLIMSISLDHQKQLGNTVKEIAAEKCGIIKYGIPCVSYLQEYPEASEAIERFAKEKNAPLTVAKAPSCIKLCENGTEFTYNNERYFIALRGVFQASNAAAALEVLFLLEKLGAKITKENIKDGFADISHPSRFEKAATNPDVIIDGAHNEGGAKALEKTLSAAYKDKKRVFVLGMCEDHLSESVIKAVIKDSDTVFTAAAKDIGRAASAQVIASAVSEVCKNVTPCESLAKALELARNAAGNDGVVCCFGSLFLASEIKEALKK